MTSTLQQRMDFLSQYAPEGGWSIEPLDPALMTPNLQRGRGRVRDLSTITFGVDVPHGFRGRVGTHRTTNGSPIALYRLGDLLLIQAGRVGVEGYHVIRRVETSPGTESAVSGVASFPQAVADLGDKTIGTLKATVDKVREAPTPAKVGLAVGPLLVIAGIVLFLVLRKG